MYYNPDTYDVLKFRHRMNDAHDLSYTGFFVPSYKALDREELVDSRGVCCIEKCKEFYKKERAKRAASPKALIKYCAEYCFTAEEAFALEGENKFNKVLISEQLTKIRLFKETCPVIEVGELDYIYKDSQHTKDNITGFKWIPNSNGKIKILEHPLWTLPAQKDEKGNIILRPTEMNNLYVAGTDGIDIGMSQTSEYTKDPSDFCMVIKKRVYGMSEPQYVAIYKDRPDNITTAFKTAIKLAQYYKAQINIEATRMSFVTWARGEGLLNLFMRRPRAALSDIVRGVSKQYGTQATQVIIEHQTDLIAEFVEDYCHNIWFEEMLDELNRYNNENKRKFDIIASMGMAEMADEELKGIIPRELNVETKSFEDFGYYIDERGYKRFGMIPGKSKFKTHVNDNFIGYENFRRTSDPRSY